MSELKRIRTEQGISANKLAIMSGVTRQHISNIEHGKVKPSVDFAKKLGTILHCDWTVFFRDSNG